MVLSSSDSDCGLPHNHPCSSILRHFVVCIDLAQGVGIPMELSLGPWSIWDVSTLAESLGLSY